MKKSIGLFLSSILLLILAGCGGGSSSDTVEVATTGSLTLGITDAPVDEAIAVIVEFDGVAVKPVNGEETVFTFEKRQIDLLALAGGGTELLLDDVELAAGEYQWIRLLVNAERGTNDSYIVLEPDANPVSLFVPSGAQSGLKLNDAFTILAGGSSDLIIDFDLRKSITDPRGQPDYFLKPRLRLIDNAEHGTISGTVAEELITAEGCSDTAAVYVFDAAVTVDGVDDIDISDDAAEGDDTNGLGGVEPVTAAAVNLNEGVYSYTAAFVEAGDYILALTCQANLDENDVDNSPDADADLTNDVTFTPVVDGITVTADTTTEYNFIVE